MKNWVRSIAVAAMLSAGAVSGAFAQAKAAPAGAASGKDLLAKSGCLACHAVDKKLVGPSYTDVANKYRSVKGAEDKITAHAPPQAYCRGRYPLDGAFHPRDQVIGAAPAAPRSRPSAGFFLLRMRPLKDSTPSPYRAAGR